MTVAHRIRLVIVGWMSVMGLYFVFVAPVLGQSQETLNERFSQAIATNAKAIERLSEIGASERLAVLEDTMFEVKWMGRTVAGALLIQIALQANENRKRK